MPLTAQPHLLRRAASWLRPAGWLLAVGGHSAWTGTEDNWLGGHALMWWSHADADTYRRWFEQAGSGDRRRGVRSRRRWRSCALLGATTFSLTRLPHRLIRSLVPDIQ
jgi:hypothetical protein